ncbi:ectoine synthase [Couchioplanes azureus]|uniref:ectoine synthase n=1 Tax=Couchioplanes caeruleus TaxID=56438 RepID=UPI00167015FB|nr:ectoine synthase [Couchioplanes caeruleus]GGQ86171.1 L-ectoine synthase [Couchioplanes caeruleus subsp. azureus]
MIIRSWDKVPNVDWGNGTSRRFLLAADGLGFTITDTTVTAGTKSRLEYRRHLEACYCIEGRGEVVDIDGNSHALEPGVLYALDAHDPHFLVASPEEDLRLVCVFSPALQGDERHNLDGDGFSQY